MAFCAQCGTQVADGAAFCGVCGSPIAGGSGGSAAGSAGGSNWSGNTYSQPGADAGYAYASGATGGLPPSPPMWDFQKNLVPKGEQIAASIGVANAKSGIGAVFGRIIRSTFLDPRIAREQALDEGGTMDAVMALVIVNLPAMLFTLLTFGFAFRFGVVTALLTFVLSVGVGIASMFVMAFLTKPILGVALSFGQLLRATAYTQGARLLSFIPVIGALIGLWSIVAWFAAMREITAAETGKLIVFILVGAVVMFAGMAILSPIFIAMFAFAR
ncbi:MAG: zinc ribbon domain-containing protein [Bryobacterales bacterium]|nr:zinc ribbon domain-containing protein [Bryobacterales bacterium]